MGYPHMFAQDECETSGTSSRTPAVSTPRSSIYELFPDIRTSRSAVNHLMNCMRAPPASAMIDIDNRAYTERAPSVRSEKKMNGCL